MNQILTPQSLTQTEPAIAHYQRIEKAIAYIRANYRRKPSLAQIAEHVHLSEYHFQKLFTQWAGISPKKFVQYLTLEHAKSELQRHASTVDTALSVGLSGTGRLHDLFITLDAVTPGEYKRHGEGLTIYYGIHSTKFGYVFIASTIRGICQLTFLEGADDTSAFEQLEHEWSNAELILDTAKNQYFVDRIFSKEQSSGVLSSANNDTLTEFRLLTKGTPFQLQVWKALLAIPYGCTTSYSCVANAIGKPKAVRAVANAIGANPLAYLIPCHRVLRGTGELGGYRWGLDRKLALLMKEQIQINELNQK